MAGYGQGSALPISLWTVGVVGGGSLLIWSAIHDPKGGPLATFRSLLQGKLPESGPQKRTALVPVPDPGGASTTPAPEGAKVSPPGDAGAAVVAAARDYIGVPYVFGGYDRRGIDCSGLVMAAYKSVGVELPHFADAQMRRGRIVSAAQARPGDVVGWPSPAYYSHIGIVLDPGHTIEAQTEGTDVGIFTMGNRAGGAPTFARILPD